MRGKPFEPGNQLGKGRPPGSRNKKTIFQEALESHGLEIVNKAKLEALKADPTALRLCVERLIPIPKAPNSRFRLPPVRTPADLTKALSAATQAVSRGRLSAQEGEAIARMLDCHRNMFETVDLDKRLEAIELKRCDN